MSLRMASMRIWMKGEKMKRFLMDAALIALLIIVGSTFKEGSSREVEEQITTFEHDQQLFLPWTGSQGENSFYTIEENKASSFAMFITNLIIGGVRTGTLAITDFFTALLV